MIAWRRKNSIHDEENKDSAYFDGAKWEWAQQQEAEENDCHGSASAKVGYSERCGLTVGVKVGFTFAKENGETETLYVTEVSAPDYVMYLPSYTPDKFDNLVNQLEEGKIVFTD